MYSQKELQKKNNNAMAANKHNLPIVDSDMYLKHPDRYELRNGTTEDAPLCPFGNRYKWIGFDKEEMKYVRLTKSVFKKVIALTGDKQFAE